MCEMAKRVLLGISMTLSLFCGMTLSQDTATCSSFIGFSVVSNMHGLGGNNNDKTTLNDCYLSCYNDATCGAFDWDPNNKILQLCWVIPKTAGDYVLPSPEVTHYARNNSCTEKVTTPPYVAPSTSTPSPTVSVSRPVSISVSVPGVSVSVPSSGQNGSGYPQSARASDNNPVNAFAIKPAYIVLAGLGAGCILLVIIAIIVICNYPLGGGSGGGRVKKVKHQKTARASIHTHQPVGTLSGHDTIPMHEVKDHAHTNGTGVTYVSSDSHMDDNLHNSHIDDHPHVTHIEEEADHHVTHVDEDHHTVHVDDEHHHHDHDNVNDHNTHTDNDSADLVENRHHSGGDVEDNPYYNGDDDDKPDRPTEGYDY